MSLSCSLQRMSPLAPLTSFLVPLQLLRANTGHGWSSGEEQDVNQVHVIHCTRFARRRSLRLRPSKALEQLNPHDHYRASRGASPEAMTSRQLGGTSEDARGDT